MAVVRLCKQFAKISKDSTFSFADDCKRAENDFLYDEPFMFSKQTSLNVVDVQGTMLDELCKENWNLCTKWRKLTFRRNRLFNLSTSEVTRCSSLRARRHSLLFSRSSCATVRRHSSNRSNNGWARHSISWLQANRVGHRARVKTDGGECGEVYKWAEKEHEDWAVWIGMSLILSRRWTSN